MTKYIESFINYSREVSEVLKYVKITTIFVKLNGEEDDDAINFWSQLLAHKHLKACMETELGHAFQRGGKKKVHQIPVSKHTRMCEDFKAYVGNLSKRINLYGTLAALISVNVIVKRKNRLQAYHENE